MKKYQRLLLKTTVQTMKRKVENGPETWVNLFDSGFVINVKKVKKGALNLLEKYIESTGKGTRKGG